jgi:hypothetical protein
MKGNPFLWFPWWPEMEESHQLPVAVLGIVLAAVLFYFAF